MVIHFTLLTLTLVVCILQSIGFSMTLRRPTYVILDLTSASITDLVALGILGIIFASQGAKPDEFKARVVAHIVSNPYRAMAFRDPNSVRIETSLC